MSSNSGYAAGGMRVLKVTECLDLLRRNDIGRLGFIVDGEPQVLPINYASEADGTVLFCTSGSSLLAHIDLQPVVFEVDGFDQRTQFGWSVCVHGTASELTAHDQPIVERIRFRRVSTWAPGLRDRWFEIRPNEITVRRIPSPADIGGWIAGVIG